MTAAHAWITLVMGGSSYVPGALCLAHSLRKSGSIYPIICMVTPEVPVAAVEALGSVFDKVVTVGVLRRKCRDLPTIKQKKIYSGWIERSFTKLHVYNPGLFGEYESVAFLDADQAVIRNPDTIFDYSSPAGIFADFPWNSATNRQRQTQNYFKDVAYGSAVPRETIMAALEGYGFVLSGSAFVVSPSERDYAKVLEIVGRLGVFGYKKCFSGFDEQCLALVMESPVNIPGYYSYFVGKEYIGMTAGQDPRTNENIKIVHYYGNTKPWDIYKKEGDIKTKKIRWPDLLIWWDHARELYAERPELKPWFFVSTRPEI